MNVNVQRVKSRRPKVQLTSLIKCKMLVGAEKVHWLYNNTSQYLINLSSLSLQQKLIPVTPLLIVRFSCK